MAILVRHSLSQLSTERREFLRKAFLLFGIAAFPLACALIFPSVEDWLPDIFRSSPLVGGLAILVTGIESGIGYFLLGDWAVRWKQENQKPSRWDQIMGDNSPLSGSLTVLLGAAMVLSLVGILTVLLALLKGRGNLVRWTNY